MLAREDTRGIFIIEALLVLIFVGLTLKAIIHFEFSSRRNEKRIIREWRKSMNELPTECVIARSVRGIEITECLGHERRVILLGGG